MSRTLDPTLAAMVADQQINNNPENNSQNSQKKLDNDENNSYIIENKGEGENNNATVGDPELEKYQRVLDQTFKGDATKAVKSWAEAQALIAEKNKELKKIQQPYENLNAVLQKNPTLFDMIKRASQGEDVENLLRAKEPMGQPVSTNTASELEDSIDEKTLSKAGLIDPALKSTMSDYEWNSKVLQATQRYMITEYPKIAAQKYQEEIRKVQQEENSRVMQDQLNRENNRRYTEGIKEAAIQGWDFNGEHAELLDELEEELIGLRDPKNLHLIRQDAVEIALDRLSRSKGIQLQQQQKPNAPMNLRQQQTNINSRGTKQLQEEPKDFMEMLLQKGMEKHRNKNGDYLQNYRTKK
jgi:hypothetical protein